MTHYVCTGGCMGLAQEPGVCQMPTCPKHGLPLNACNCEDGKHAEVMAKAQEKHNE